MDGGRVCWGAQVRAGIVVYLATFKDQDGLAVENQQSTEESVWNVTLRVKLVVGKPRGQKYVARSVRILVIDCGFLQGSTS